MAPGEPSRGAFCVAAVIMSAARFTLGPAVRDMDSRELFLHAHLRARRQDLLARLGGRDNDLLPFEALAEILQVYQQIPKRQPEMIPLDKIVGSVGRYRDFTRDFLPRNPALQPRWARIDDAMNSLEGVPPIEVYKIGDVYFVADGNHRVSVARANGFDAIEAYVTELPVNVDLKPGDSLDQAIIKAERARFLAETHLDRHFPNLDIYFTKPGGFRRLLEHIEIHRRLMSQERPEAGEISLEEAAVDWYTNSYLPIITTIRERQLLKRFPDRTASDLYVWIWGCIMELYRLFGEKVSPDEAASLMELRASSEFRGAIQELMRRLGEVSRALTGTPNDVPDWVTQTFEWGDVALELAEKGNGA
jgi:hypothetical protein